MQPDEFRTKLAHLVGGAIHSPDVDVQDVVDALEREREKVEATGEQWGEL